MLPPLNEEYHPGLNPNTPEEDFLIDPAQVKEALKNAGKDVQRIDSLPGGHMRHGGPARRGSGGGGRASPSGRNSWAEPPLPLSNSTSRRPSTVSSTSTGVDYAVSDLPARNQIRQIDGARRYRLECINVSRPLL